MKSQPWGRKTPSASTHRPRRLSAPAPSAFALPRPRSHFPRIAFRGSRGAIGLPQQQLSTMGYPRKSYPHRCSPPCAKRSRPRACARVYIIYRSPVGRSPGVSAPLRKRVRVVVTPWPAPPSAGWGRAKAKAGRILSQCRTMPLVCRITVRKGGSAPGQPWPCPCALPAATCLRPCPRPLMGEAPCALPAATCLRPRPRLLMGEAPCALPAATCLRPRPRPLMGVAPCVLPATACLPPRPRPLMGEAPSALPAAACLPPRPRRLNGHPASAGGRENDRMAHRRTTTPTHRTRSGNDTCTIRVPRRKGAQSVVHNL